MVRNNFLKLYFPPPIILWFGWALYSLHLGSLVWLDQASRSAVREHQLASLLHLAIGWDVSALHAASSASKFPYITDSGPGSQGMKAEAARPPMDCAPELTQHRFCHILLVIGSHELSPDSRDREFLLGEAAKQFLLGEAMA